jgi:outer membrane protein assembly factor BamB
LNAANGAKIWSYTTGDEVESSPAVVNGVVYIGSNDWNIYALNAVNGAKIWSYTTGNWVVSSPAVVNGVVYVGSDDGKVYAFGALSTTSPSSSSTSTASPSPTIPETTPLFAIASLIVATSLIAIVIKKKTQNVKPT